MRASNNTSSTSSTQHSLNSPTTPSPTFHVKATRLLTTWRAKALTPHLYTNIRLPDTLLRKAEICHAAQAQTLTLHERPHVHLPLPAAYWHQHPAHRMDLVRYLAKHTTNKAQGTQFSTGAPATTAKAASIPKVQPYFNKNSIDTSHSSMQPQ